MPDKPLDSIPASEAYARARGNAIRRYPAPNRDGDRLYPLASPQAHPSFRMSTKDRVFTIGSCFARNVESALKEIGIEIVSDVPDLGPIGDALGYAANLFNKYSIHSVHNDLKWALERESYPGDAVIYELPGGGFCDLQLGIPKLDFPQIEIQKFRQRYLDVFTRVADADVIILTLGYVETWFDTELGIYLNTAPPQALVKMHPSRFEFRVLSYQDVLDGLRSVYDLLAKHRNKPLRMLLTVSPVPLLSTFREIDVLMANTYSKSVQRAAIDEFVRDVEGVDYFPSYEFVMLSNPSVAWSRGDFRHVSPDLVARIMSNVITTYVDDGPSDESAAEREMTAPALLSSARMLFKAEEYEALKDLAAKHFEVVESDHDLRVLLGNACVKLRELEDAFEHFEAAYALNQSRPAVLERLITLCRPLRRKDREVAFLEEHIERFPARSVFRERVSGAEKAAQPRPAAASQQQSFLQPDLSKSISKQIDHLRNALVVPPPKGDPNRSVQQSGVLNAKGAFMERSVTWRNGSQVNTAPPIPDPTEVQNLSGRHLFLGPLFGHFGHFLVESISRLWALDHLEAEVDGLVFVPKFQNRPQHVLDTYRPFLELLGAKLPVRNLEHPTLVEELHVPLQGFGMFDLIQGAPEFRNFINTHAGAEITADGPEKIYISRTGLPPERGGVLGEQILEDLLIEEGFEPFHPQMHDYATQVAVYKAARQIISVDASPLHLVAMVGDEDQRIACIARRPGELDQVFAKQLRAFKGSHVSTINALKRNWIPESDTRPSRVSLGEVDFAQIYFALHEAGFLSGTTPWQHFSDKERTRLLNELKAKRGLPLKPFETEEAA